MGNNAKEKIGLVTPTLEQFVFINNIIYVMTVKWNAKQSQ